MMQSPEKTPQDKVSGIKIVFDRHQEQKNDISKSKKGEKQKWEFLARK